MAAVLFFSWFYDYSYFTTLMRKLFNIGCCVTTIQDSIAVFCYSDYRLMGTDIKFYFCILPMNTSVGTFNTRHVIHTKILQFLRIILTSHSYVQLIYIRNIIPAVYDIFFFFSVEIFMAHNSYANHIKSRKVIMYLFCEK